MRYVCKSLRHFVKFCVISQMPKEYVRSSTMIWFIRYYGQAEHYIKLTILVLELIIRYLDLIIRNYDSANHYIYWTICYRLYSLSRFRNSLYRYSICYRRIVIRYLVHMIKLDLNIYYLYLGIRYFDLII